MELAQRDRRNRAIVFLLLTAAFAARMYLAGQAAYAWDEDRYWIPLARSISFEPGSLNLPVRGGSHPALPAYMIRAGSALFGESHYGYRIASILAGMITIAVATLLARRWLGWGAATAAAALLSFNEYHLGLSVFATEKIFSLMFLMVSLLAFVEFLRSERKWLLYAAGAAVGFSFLCREITVLALPVYFLALLVAGKQTWLKRKEPYLAAALFFLVISPDLVWNAMQPAAAAHGEEGYREHFGRIGGIGFSRQHFLFYGRGLVEQIYRLRGASLLDPARAYAAMNSAAGLLMLGCAFLSLLRWKRLDGAARALCLLFFFVLTFFVLVKPGQPKPGLDAVVWFWVDSTLLPGVLLIAYVLSREQGIILNVARALCVVAVLIGVASVARGLPPLRPYSLALSPVIIWPDDGRWVPLRVTFDSCHFCKPTVRFTGAVINDHNGQEPRVATAEDFRALSPGEDVRDFEIRAVRQPGSLMRDYVLSFDFQEPGGGVLPRATSARIAVEERLLPFWAEPPPARPGD